MYTFSLPLDETAAALRSGQLDLLDHVEAICDRIETAEPHIQALLPEPGRRARLRREAQALHSRYAEPSGRPPLYGILLGVKDIFHAEGFPTQAGSKLPATLFSGKEATSVTLLKKAGALVLAKTVTTEFAYFQPGPTRNPHDPAHTPGGSSSGSAAAVAAGFCPLALGTQTIGSVIRPAAFCGIVGFKPSYDRIPSAGLIYFSRSVDHVGIFTQDVAGMAQAAAVLCVDWRAGAAQAQVDPPVLGVPDGPYLSQASDEGLAAFEQQLDRLQQAGVCVKRVPALADIETINRRHRRLIAAEAAQVHADWYAHHAALYSEPMRQVVEEGRDVGEAELEAARAGRQHLCQTLQNLLTENEADLWVAPAATGPAPQGIETTGDPIMNLPWTHAGVPVVTLPAGNAANGLPLGLQLAAPFGDDEHLLAWAGTLSDLL